MLLRPKNKNWLEMVSREAGRILEELGVVLDREQVPMVPTKLPDSWRFLAVGGGFGDISPIEKKIIKEKEPNLCRQFSQIHVKTLGFYR